MQSLAASARISVPYVVGQYRLNELLSDHRHYADYAGCHALLGHPVLVRHERWPSQPGEELRLEALRRARRLQAELRCPSIVPVVDFFHSHGRWFSVFLWMKDAITLGALTKAIISKRRPRLLLREYMAICEGITGALAEIHRAGFIHRTLNLGNVLVDTNGVGHVADIGCAMRCGEEDEATRAARSFGTRWTAAPEQLDQRESLTTQVDIWALGVLLYYLRYLRHPYATDGATMAEILGGVLVRELDFPGTGASGDSTWEDRDDGVEELVRPWLSRMLAKEPSRRFRDAIEVERGLRVILARVENRSPRARAFVAMPFAAPLEPLWRCIEAVCFETEVLPVRVDQAISHDNIWSEIRSELEKSDLMIAVVSALPALEANPNVMLEIGFMRALSRKVLLITGDAAALPFDLRTDRAVTCDFDGSVDPTFVDRLSGALRSLLKVMSPEPDAVGSEPGCPKPRTRRS